MLHSVVDNYHGICPVSTESCASSFSFTYLLIFEMRPQMKRFDIQTRELFHCTTNSVPVYVLDFVLFQVLLGAQSVRSTIAVLRPLFLTILVLYERKIEKEFGHESFLLANLCCLALGLAHFPSCFPLSRSRKQSIRFRVTTHSVTLLTQFPNPVFDRCQ